MKRYTATGLSLPNDLIQKIDSDRGDVSRSRYLLRLLEKVYQVSANYSINQDYANLVPPLSADEYESLKESMKQYGQWVPITRNSQGVILDGHHRYKICQEIGIEPKFETKDFPDKLHEQIFVIDSNLRRRHLNNFQRTELALKSKSILQEIANKNSRANLKQQRNVPSDRNLTVGGIGGRVDEKIAGLAGVSRDTVRKVEAIQQAAEEKPHLDFIVKRVRNGEISTNEAHRIINDIDEESEKQGRWYKLKEEVMKGDGNKCRDCGSILHLEVYTIDRYGDKYELENLETLCEDCHRLKKQFGGSGIIAASAWMFQHLTGMPGRRYFEYSTIGGSILYDIIKNRELSPHDEEMKNNPYVKLKRASDAELTAKTRSHRKQLLAQVPFVYGDRAIYAAKEILDDLLPVLNDFDRQRSRCKEEKR